MLINARLGPVWRKPFGLIGAVLQDPRKHLYIPKEGGDSGWSSLPLRILPRSRSCFVPEKKARTRNEVEKSSWGKRRGLRIGVLPSSFLFLWFLISSSRRLPPQRVQLKLRLRLNNSAKITGYAFLGHGGEKRPAVVYRPQLRTFLPVCLVVLLSTFSRLIVCRAVWLLFAFVPPVYTLANFFSFFFPLLFCFSFLRGVRWKLGGFGGRSTLGVAD